MKKSVFLLGLLTIAGISLTACGSKNYEMSFEEALEIANHSELQDILAQSDSFEQDFSIAGSYEADWTKIDANLSATSKQSEKNKNSEASTTFWANITAEWETIKVNWALDIKQISDMIYLNLSSLDLTGSENLGMVSMMAEWFKNQWFSIPMTGLSEIPSTFSVLKDSKDLEGQSKEIVINEGSTTYNWKFTQFNGYNARKISLDNEKLNALIKNYYDSMNTNLDDEYAQEAPELNIQSFEWYLVITGKDKVTTVIEDMKIQDEDTSIIANWFAGEDYEINLSEWEETLVTITANKKAWKYEVSAKIADAISLDWTISPKLSKSSIDLKFDAKITVKAEEEWGADTIIPFKGSWKYNVISDFATSVPENAQDLSELIWWYLGGMMWWDDYDYDYDEDYDYDYEDYDYNEELNDENIEWLENILEPEEAQPEEIQAEEMPVEETVAE